MTDTFGEYASYYDLLYQDKDYEAEAGFLDDQIKRFAPGAKTLLDLGCGTGNHDFWFCKKGYSVTGVDSSKKNIETANAKQLAKTASSSTLYFIKDDIRSIRTKKRYDVAVSLFHVMSYLVTNDDLKAAFATARVHLNKGGLFLFDCWYGPAVLSDRPSLRVKRAESDDFSLVRIAEPELYPNTNRVDVNYQVLVVDKETRCVTELQEIHRMRYLFKPEIDQLLTDSGFKLLHWGEWLSDSEPELNTWSAYFVASAVK